MCVCVCHYYPLIIGFANSSFGGGRRWSLWVEFGFCVGVCVCVCLRLIVSEGAAPQGQVLLASMLAGQSLPRASSFVKPRSVWKEGNHKTTHILEHPDWPWQTIKRHLIGSETVGPLASGATQTRERTESRVRFGDWQRQTTKTHGVLKRHYV